ncbi:MAG: substrate-binding domain-containing protein [Bacteroidota bacterium]
MDQKIKISLATLALLIFYACNTSENPLMYQTDTNSRGKATILVEESFKRLFDTSIYTFESQFPKADIVPEYMSEGDIIDAFYKNKSKTIVISRDFTEDEKKFLKSKTIQVRSNRIAIDAVALIVNPANTDTAMTIAHLKEILTGKLTKWDALKTNINVVYDQNNSANFNYLKTYCGTDKLNKNVFAVHSNEEVINYVKKNPSAIGVIGSNWISDQEDFDVLNFLDGIKVVALAEKEGANFFLPYSGFMYTKEYPLVRDIWMINKGKRAGINSGFVNFMIGDLGQTIVQKCELVPAINPVRLIQFQAE